MGDIQVYSWDWESLRGMWAEVRGRGLVILCDVRHEQADGATAWIIDPKRRMKDHRGVLMVKVQNIDDIRVRPDIPRAFNPDGTPPETGYEPVAPNNRFGIAATDSEVIISDNQERVTIRVPAHQAAHMGMAVVAAATETGKDK